jgi:hypothetical protein
MAAKAAGIPTGGFMPRGFLTEDGPRPEFAEIYGAREHPSPKYPPRTRRNVEDADVTIVFDASRGRSLESLSSGSQLAINTAMELGRPSLVVAVRLGEPIDPKRPAALAERLARDGYRVVNIGGNRESRTPGIGSWTEDYLVAVFRLLAATPTTPTLEDPR